MKVLILNGSPKQNASDTMHLTRAFSAGMNDVEENQLHTIHVINQHIEYCTGCFTCKKNGGPCIHNDDMRDFSKLRYLMICGCGFPNSKNNFEPMVLQFGLLFPNQSTLPWNGTMQHLLYWGSC